MGAIGNLNLNNVNSTINVQNNGSINKIDSTTAQTGATQIVNNGDIQEASSFTMDESTFVLNNNSNLQSLSLAGNGGQSGVINNGDIFAASLALDNSVAQIVNNKNLNQVSGSTSNGSSVAITNNAQMQEMSLNANSGSSVFVENNANLATTNLSLNNSFSQVENNANMNTFNTTATAQSQAVTINNANMGTANLNLNNSAAQLQNNANIGNINANEANQASVYIDNNHNIGNINANLQTQSAFQIDNEGALVQRNYLDTTTVTNTYNTHTKTTNNYYATDEVYTVNANGKGAAYGLYEDQAVTSKLKAAAGKDDGNNGYWEIRNAAGNYGYVGNGYSNTVDNTNYSYNNGVGTYTVYGASSNKGVHTTTSSTTSLANSTNSTSRTLTSQEVLDAGGTVGSININADGNSQAYVNNEADMYKDVFSQKTVTNNVFTSSSSVSNTYTGGQGNVVVKLVNMGKGNWDSPVVLDLNGDGVKTTTQEDGILFDIDGNGKLNQTAWAAGGDAVLAYDADGDGTITSGKELFGEHSDFNNDGVKDGLNGFEALAQFDKNNDGVLKGEELEGIKAIVNGEVKDLSEVGVSEISVKAVGEQYMNAETNGNKYLDGEGATVNGLNANIADVWFQNTATNLKASKQYGFSIA